MNTSLQFWPFLTLFCCILFSLSSASPRGANRSSLQRRTDPVFPDSPPSCPICQANWTNIEYCAQTVPVLANFTSVISSPFAFASVILCACTSTFEAVFPECADCFDETGQTDVMNTPNLTAVVDGVNQVCAVEGSFFGSSSGIVSSSTPTVIATPTTSAVSTSRALKKQSSLPGFAAVALAVIGTII